MTSWQMHCFDHSLRLFVRRRTWGKDEPALVRRARRWFGAPIIYQRLLIRGLHVSTVSEPDVGGFGRAAHDCGAAVILYLHGGGFVSCSAQTHRPITTALARLSQARVFALDYRLAPEHRFPAALDDALAAYRWLLAQNLPAGQIALAGDSAGGGLVLSLLVRIRDAGLPLPAGAVCFSAWTDLAGANASILGNDGRCAMFRSQNIAAFARAYLGDASALDPAASPARADLSGLPPLLLQVGSTELLLDDSRRVHQKVQAAGGVSQLEVLANAPHGLQLLTGFVPEARRLLYQAAGFIRRCAADKI